MEFGRRELNEVVGRRKQEDKVPDFSKPFYGSENDPVPNFMFNDAIADMENEVPFDHLSHIDKM